jgi:hypothetical protein
MATELTKEVAEEVQWFYDKTKDMVVTRTGTFGEPYWSQLSEEAQDYINEIEGTQFLEGVHKIAIAFKTVLGSASIAYDIWGLLTGNDTSDRREGIGDRNRFTG